MRLLKGKPTRTESLGIRMDVDGKSAYTKHSRSLRDLPLTKPIEDFEDGDILKVDYTLDINYFGDVAKALQAVADICSDPNVVVTASCADLTQGRILCYEAFRKLDAIIKRIESR